MIHINFLGDLDVCYYNFECLVSFKNLHDFGHVFSNIGYTIFGTAFIIIVYFRNMKKYVKNNNDVGIYYALGLTSICEGILSSFYHICPSTINFQFDTTFMYVMALLVLLKVYQFRHPKKTPSVYMMFAMLSLILFIEVTGYFGDILDISSYVNSFYAVFAVIHLTIILILFWYHHFKIEENRPKKSQKVFGFLMLLINVALDAFVLYEVKAEVEVEVSTYILMIVSMNMLIYFHYHLLWKLYSFFIKKVVTEKINWYTAFYLFSSVGSLAASGKLIIIISYSSILFW